MSQNKILFTKPFFALNFLGIFYLLLAIGYFFNPVLITDIFNYLPRTLNLLEMNPIPAERLATSISANYFLILAVLCFFVAYASKKTLLLTLALTINLLSLSTFIYLFVYDAKTFSTFVLIVVSLFTIFTLICTIFIKKPGKQSF